MDNEQSTSIPPVPEKPERPVLRTKPGYKSGADHWTQKRKADLLAKNQKLFEKPADQPMEVTDKITADTSIGVTAPPSEREVYNAEIERIRAARTRKPFGSLRQKLAYAEKSGYKRHWFNDFPGRVDEATQSGWTHVDDKGQPVKRIVGTGRDNGALYAFLMEIPMVFWEEDMQALADAAARPLAVIKSSPFQAAKGTAQPQDDQKFYSPRESAVDIQRK